MLNQILQNDWKTILSEEFLKPYYTNLLSFLEEEYASKTVYPERDDIFNAFQITPFEKVKVVILGQDPYHGPAQAHGLSFSVKPSIMQPPSLKNIFKELNFDLNCSIPNHGCLESWAEQGVLLLNTTLTVRAGEAASHFNKGWEILTDRVIELLNGKLTPVVFLLWGKPAQSKKKLINSSKHFVLEMAHPSPLSAHRGFFGSKPFSKTNQILEQTSQEQINWQIN